MTDTPEMIANELRNTIIILKKAEAKKKQLIKKFQDLVDYGIAQDDGEPGRFSYKGLTINKVIRRNKIYHSEIQQCLETAEEAKKNALARAEEFDLYDVTESSSWRCTATEDDK